MISLKVWDMGFNSGIVKGLCALGVMIFWSALLYGQAKKPTIMVVPSDAWCNQHGFMTSFDNLGTAMQLPDYRRAFQENTDLLNVISKINGLMADRGFPLKNLESVLKGLEEDSAEDALTMSKDGGEIVETPIDKLRKRAQADIIMQLTWSLSEIGPKTAVTYNLQGLDAYTDKQIATAQGTGDPSFSAPLPVLLEEAVVAHMDNFTARLQDHFDDLFENGREITVKVKTFDTWEYDLEEEFDGEELTFIIEDWFFENTVQGRFNTTVATESTMLFEQVRIPLFDERDRPVDSRRFIRGLNRFLRDEPYNITNKLVTKGLGEVTLILGGK